MQVVCKAVPRQDERQVRDLIDVVLGSLVRWEFFIPYAAWELERLFDESYALLHGAYDEGKLVGMSQLYCEEALLAECRTKLGLTGVRICELGGNLVLAEYRGRGIMYQLAQLQVGVARERRYEYVVAMAHPDNAGSIATLLKMGMVFARTDVVAEKYLRRMYMLQL
jgi:GNAT superfamily N-acetyltransferase